MKTNSSKMLAQGAMIAALYVVLTYLFEPISFGKGGAVQLRLSEALTVLPVFTPSAVFGLFAGCLLGNLMCGAALFDIVLGSLATLAAALCTRLLRKRRIAAMAMPVLFNGLVVGGYLPFVYGLPISVPLSMLSVAAGEAAACILGGGLLTYIIERTRIFD